MKLTKIENTVTLFVLVGVIALIGILTSLTIIPLLTIWNLVVNLDWNGYWFWASIGITASRVIAIILIPITIVAPFWSKKWWLWIDTIGLVIYAIYGLPLLLWALNTLIFTPLIGLELQRTMLTYIIIEVWSIVLFKSIGEGIKKDQEK